MTRNALAAFGILFLAKVAAAQFPPQETKLVGAGWASGYMDIDGRFDYSVALSADGSTAAVGGAGTGAGRVFRRSAGIWSQEPDIPTPSNANGPGQCSVVALSGDGNTAIVGCPKDYDGVGAAWVYTRSSGVWTQQGTKLVGSGATGSARQGASVALSADGNTAVVGGPFDSYECNISGCDECNISGCGTTVGAAWVYTRTDGSWTQQGPKLVGSGAAGDWPEQGYAVALSGDGNTAIVSGWGDDFHWGVPSVGAAWVYTRSGGVWAQQGPKLVGSGAAEERWLGLSVALSSDGNTALVGEPWDDGGAGAASVYTRSSGVWSQQGDKLIGNGAGVPACQGLSVAMSASGLTMLVGGPTDLDGGAVWIYSTPQVSRPEVPVTSQVD